MEYAGLTWEKAQGYHFRMARASVDRDATGKPIKAGYVVIIPTKTLKTDKNGRFNAELLKQIEPSFPHLYSQANMVVSGKPQIRTAKIAVRMTDGTWCRTGQTYEVITMYLVHNDEVFVTRVRKAFNEES